MPTASSASNQTPSAQGAASVALTSCPWKEQPWREKRRNTASPISGGELVPEGTENLIHDYHGKFEAFLIQVKSEEPEGHDLANDPLNVLSHVDEIRKAFHLPDKGSLDHPDHPDHDPDNCSPERNELRATVTRLNAERPANRVHRAEVWVAFFDSPPVLGAMQYKYCHDQTSAEGQSAEG